VTITAGDQTVEATINDSQVSQDFLAALPTTLPWERNGGIEYITELPAPMTETGPFYTEVEAGDIVYYQPAGQHHHHLRPHLLGPHPHQDGRDHL
jgi:hypothetical protein